jgi:thiamine monophosphate synthase
MPKKNITFTKIAILNAATTLAGISENDDEIYYYMIKKWARVARERGMDAAYIRAYESREDKIKLIISAIHEVGAKVIITMIYHSIHLAADAYHLRGVDTPERNNRTQNIIGKSCHSIEEVVAADHGGLDYVFFSPIFPTNTHPDAQSLGLDTLYDACRATRLPVFALGGVNISNEECCIVAGAHGVAAISMFL